MWKVTDEIISQVRRMLKGIPVDDDTMGVEVVKEVGCEGNFLTHPHTLKHLRATQWVPQLICRKDHAGWLDSGGKSFVERASDRVEDILANHKPLQLPPEKQQALQKIVDEYQGNG